MAGTRLLVPMAGIRQDSHSLPDHRERSSLLDEWKCPMRIVAAAPGEPGYQLAAASSHTPCRAPGGHGLTRLQFRLRLEGNARPSPKVFTYSSSTSGTGNSPIRNMQSGTGGPNGVWRWNWTGGRTAPPCGFRQLSFRPGHDSNNSYLVLPLVRISPLRTTPPKPC